MGMLSQCWLSIKTFVTNRIQRRRNYFCILSHWWLSIKDITLQNTKNAQFLHGMAYYIIVSLGFKDICNPSKHKNNRFLNNIRKNDLHLETKIIFVLKQIVMVFPSCVNYLNYHEDSLSLYT